MFVRDLLVNGSVLTTSSLVKLELETIGQTDTTQKGAGLIGMHSSLKAVGNVEVL